MRYLGVEDNAITTLVFGIDNIVTSFVVSDASVFTGAEVPFTATLFNALETVVEVVLVTDVDFGTNTLTVERGYLFTPVPHDPGHSVELRVMSQHVGDLNENNIVLIQQNSYIEHVKNGTGQVTTTTVWEDSGKTTKIAEVTYTFTDTKTKLPATATRVIYYADGVTVRRTETTTFTVANGEIVNMEKVIT